MTRTAHLTVLAVLAVVPLRAAESAPTQPEAACCLKTMNARGTPSKPRRT